jgi:Arm DNA-binding domain/Phage integrase, N-terminal SAM-like domain
MRGSVRKRGSTYSYWLDIGPDPLTGKRRQRTKGGFRTKRECQAALNEAISALRSGTLVQPSRRTVASFLVEEWLPAVRMTGLRDSTWASYRMNVEKHLVPGLGAIELQRLSPAQLNAFYRAAYKGPPQQGRRAGAEDGALHPFDPAPGAARCGALGRCRAERGRCC